MQTKTARFLSSGIIPIKKINGVWHFLILRCFRYWDFPKGHVEPDEDPWVAAVREMQEETGLGQLEFRWGKLFVETEIYGQGKIARYYLAEVISQDKVQLLPNPENGVIEHQEFRWVSFEAGHSMLVPRVQKILEWAQQQLN